MVIASKRQDADEHDDDKQRHDHGSGIGDAEVHKLLSLLQYHDVAAMIAVDQWIPAP